MRIINLEIEGYRSFKSQTWQPDGLNVLIGPNASGKSNLLRVLELLKALAKGNLGRLIQREGGMESILWDGSADHVRLKAKMTPLPPYQNDKTDALTYEIVLARLGKSSAYRIDREILGNFHNVEDGGEPEPYKLLERDPNHARVFSIESQEFEAPPDSVPEQEALLSVAAGPFVANPFIGAFQKELSKWGVYQGFQTHREAPIRAPQITRADRHVEPDGQNLISVLHTHYQGDREFKQEINLAMRAAFGDDFDELVFPPAADQRIQMRIRWKSLKREQAAADLSDGTLRFLFLLTVLADPKPLPLIAIDEPETGLHPAMFPIISEFARDAAQKSQVILTTHSPDFLDACGDEPPTTTVVERHDGQTALRVPPADELSYWLKQYSLGELFRSRELEAMK